jgi:iron complex transport system substrate-binding protein
MILMLSKYIRYSLFFALVVLISCKSVNDPDKNFLDDKFKEVNSEVKEARYFDLYRSTDMMKVVIHSPFGDGADQTLYLADSEVYEKYKRYDGVIKVPLKRVAVLSSTQLYAVRLLGLLDAVQGVSDEKYIGDPVVKRYLKEGKITEVAVGGQFFTEKALMLGLDGVFFSPFSRDMNLKLDEKIPVIPFFDFMENTPLGRAEWIKFTAAFLGGQKKADLYFDSLSVRYNDLKKKALSRKKKPSVFSGRYLNGQWFVPGGKSYIARIFEDAGADYIFSDDPSVNSVLLDFEVVFDRARNADYWRMTGGLDTDKDVYTFLSSENELYTHFKAFKEHHIVYCDPQATGYFEKGALEPDVVLADFIFVFHKELLPGHIPVHYRMLH